MFRGFPGPTGIFMHTSLGVNVVNCSTVEKAIRPASSHTPLLTFAGARVKEGFREGVEEGDADGSIEGEAEGDADGEYEGA